VGRVQAAKLDKWLRLVVTPGRIASLRAVDIATFTGCADDSYDACRYQGRAACLLA
jgi:hypothetical protein